MLTLADAVSQLYGGSTETFVERRTKLVTQARAEGNHELVAQIKALRRPTLSAAIVNRLAPEDLSPLFEIGSGLRAAQTRLDASALKELTRRRTETIESIIRGVDASPSVREEVRSTLLAATADGEAQRAVASGALVRALRYAGWGDVDLADAVAHREATQHGRAALRLVLGDVATFNVDSGASANERRDAERDAAEHDRQRAEARRQAQEKRVGAARDELDRARRRLAAADDAYRAARAARASAEVAVTQAEHMLSILMRQGSGNVDAASAPSPQ